MTNKTEVLDLIDGFLAEIGMTKVAAEAQEKVEGAASKGLSAEQQAAAKQSGSTTGETVTDSDGAVSGVMAETPAATIDGCVAVKTTQDKEKENEVMANKVAKLQEIGSAIVSLANAKIEAANAAEMQKKASVEARSKMSKEEVAFEQFIQKQAEEAAKYAQGEYEKNLAGRLARIQHEVELEKAASEDPQIRAAVNALGGTSAALQKLAEEAPEVLDPTLAEGAEGAAEGATEGAAGLDEAGIDQIAQLISDAGYTEQDVMEALQVLEGLQSQGFTPEEIQETIAEMMQGEAPAEAAPAEEAAPAKDLAKQASEAAGRRAYIQRQLRK